MTRFLLAIAAATLAGAAATAQSRPPERLGIGSAAPRDLMAALDADVGPEGTGLPPGRGTAREGADVYARQCAACHGGKGEGGTADALVSTEPRGVAPFGPEYERWRGARPDVPFTIGNYWPFAPTLFDYVRRAMPFAAPGTLSSDEVYAVVAWLLAQNGIIAETDAMTAESLPRVIMPARGRFVPDDRRGGPQVR